MKLPPPVLRRFRRASRAVALRLGLQRSLDGAVRALPLCVAVAGLVVVADRPFGFLSAAAGGEANLAGVLAAVACTAAVLLGLVRDAPRAHPLAGAVRLDRSHSLEGRLAGALEFDRVPETLRSPLMQLALDDAAKVSAPFRPASAAPLRLPVGWRRALLVGAAFGVVAFAAPALRSAPRLASFPRLALGPLGERLLSRDEADALAARADAIEATTDDPDVRAVARALRALAQAAQTMERRELYQRADRLDRRVRALAGRANRAGVDRLSAALADLRASARANGADEGRAGRLDALADRVDGAVGPDGADEPKVQPPPPPPGPSDGPPGICHGNGDEGSEEGDRGRRVGRNEAREPGGDGAGVGHVPSAGEKTKGMLAKRDVRERGVRNPSGKVKSATVRAAAQRGVRTGGYEAAFRAYETKVEKQIRAERVPPGMSFYVRGYFDRIRPRE